MLQARNKSRGMVFGVAPASRLVPVSSHDDFNYSKSENGKRAKENKFGDGEKQFFIRINFSLDAKCH